MSGKARYTWLALIVVRELMLFFSKNEAGLLLALGLPRVMLLGGFGCRALAVAGLFWADGG